MRRSKHIVAAALWLCAVQSQAADAWIFRFASVSPAASLRWSDDLVFYNASSLQAAVRLIDVSNGGPRPGDPAEVQVAAGRSVSLLNFGDVWKPAEASLWVVHLDIPSGVLTFSRGGANGVCPSPCVPPPQSDPSLGAFAMQVFPSLVPASHEQLFMGTDQGFSPSRINVGIYNAGAAQGTATISVFQACDDSVLESRSVAIPANTALQFGGFGSVRTQCGNSGLVNTWLRYTVVSVDQPSLAYVANLADPLPPFAQVPLSISVGP